MKKLLNRIIAFSIAALLVASLTAAAFAQPQKPYVNDEMDVFTDEEERILTQRVKEIRDEYDIDVVLLTVENLGNKTAEEYADDYFDYNGFGKNTYRDGVLFMISRNPRKWAISTCGYGIEVFTPVGQEYIMDKVLPYLKDDEYYKAFAEFAKLSDKFINEAVTSEPYDTNHQVPRSFKTYFVWFLFSLAAGFVISYLIANIMKSRLRSVSMKREANDYVKKDSLVLTNKEDIYLNRSVTYTVIERNSSSGSNSSGSDRHSGSSGGTHGGSSGSY